MNRRVWINRAAAGACLGLAALCTISAGAIVGDIRAVRAAHARDDATPAAPASSVRMDVRTLRPVLRRGNAEARVAVGEFLNGRLGVLGLHILSADVATLRPLGGGLQLAEVRIEGRGDMAAAGAVANWVAANREAVRLKSLAVSSGAEGEAQASLVLLMVIA